MGRFGRLECSVENDAGGGAWSCWTSGEGWIVRNDGAAADYDAVDDVAEIARGMERGIAELVDAAAAAQGAEEAEKTLALFSEMGQAVEAFDNAA